MQKYILFLAMIQNSIFVHSMEESERGEEQKIFSSVSSMVVQPGSVPSGISRSESVVSEETSIETIATSIEQLVQISRQNNTLLTNFVKLQNEQLALQKQKFKMKKKEMKFDTAVAICSLQASLETESPHSRIRSGFGAWSIVEEANERLKIEERKKIKNLDAAIVREEQEKKAKKFSKKSDPETARHSMKKTQKVMSARNKRNNKKS